jgi:hypothetical protein
MILHGGEIQLTSVHLFNDISEVISEMKKLNTKFNLFEEPFFSQFINFTHTSDSFFYNSVVSVTLLNDNFDELFFASDLFEGMKIPDKQEVVNQAELSDQRAFFKIKAASQSDYYLSLLFTVAFCNITKGVIDLTTFPKESSGFEKDRYYYPDWENEVLTKFSR